MAAWTAVSELIRRFGWVGAVLFIVSCYVVTSIEGANAHQVCVRLLFRRSGIVVIEGEILDAYLDV